MRRSPAACDSNRGSRDEYKVDSRQAQRPESKGSPSDPCPSYPTSQSTSKRSSGGSPAKSSSVCRIQAAFLLRTFDPPIESVFGKKVREIRRVGKRIAIGLDDDLWIVLHLMIAGRLAWKGQGAKLGGKIALAAFDFPKGTLVFTEAGSKRRASLHVLRGEDALRLQDPGGIEPLSATFDQFEAVLRSQNHTLKRSLTDPASFQRHRQRLFRRDPPSRAFVSSVLSPKS